jgi:cytochrome b561
MAGTDRTYSATARGLHWLIVLHAAAALYHHLARHDGTLRRMLPSSRP